MRVSSLSTSKTWKSAETAWLLVLLTDSCVYRVHELALPRVRHLRRSRAVQVKLHRAGSQVLMLVNILYKSGVTVPYNRVRMVSQYKDTLILYSKDYAVAPIYVTDVNNIDCVTTHEKDQP